MKRPITMSKVVNRWFKSIRRQSESIRNNKNRNKNNIRNSPNSTWWKIVRNLFIKGGNAINHRRLKTLIEVDMLLKLPKRCRKPKVKMHVYGSRNVQLPGARASTPDKHIHTV